MADKVSFLSGDALKLLKSTPGDFDIIFCDVDKHQYPQAYEIMRERVRLGGVIVIDNLIWNGQVAAGDDDGCLCLVAFSASSLA